MAIYQGGIKVSGISQIRYYDLGGVCNTAANEAAKEIIIDNFVLTSGVTIKALFTNANTELNPTITVKDSSGNIKASGIAIKGTRAGSKIDLVLHSGKWRGADTYTDEMWQAYTTLELMYDGTDFVIMGNPLFESYVSESGDKGYSVYSNGEIEQYTSGNLTSSYNFEWDFFVIYVNGYYTNACYGYDNNAYPISYKANSTVTTNSHVRFGCNAGAGQPVRCFAKGF